MQIAAIAVPEFTDAAVDLWKLQNEATTAEAVAIMGERVSAARYVSRQEQAEKARAAFTRALNEASAREISEYTELLRWRAANGMR